MCAWNRIAKRKQEVHSVRGGIVGRMEHVSSEKSHGEGELKQCLKEGQSFPNEGSSQMVGKITKK